LAIFVVGFVASTATLIGGQEGDPKPNPKAKSKVQTKSSKTSNAGSSSKAKKADGEGAGEANEAEKPDESAMEAAMDSLKKVQDIVGEWEGSGAGDASKGWDEKAAVSWKFNKDGSAGLNLSFAAKDEDAKAKPMLKSALLSFDVAKDKYVLKAVAADADDEMTFEGSAKTDTNLVFDRVDKKKADANDAIDRIDLKLINDGDRVVYTLFRRLGAGKRFKETARVALDRQGTSLAGAVASGPKCIVTGGAGTMTVSHNGKTYYVCCTGCREMFPEAPEKYIAKADKKSSEK
jgi:YHS domain-containing protein